MDLIQEGVQGNMAGDKLCQDTGGVVWKAGEEIQETMVRELGTNMRYLLCSG